MMLRIYLTCAVVSVSAGCRVKADCTYHLEAAGLQVCSETELAPGAASMLIGIVAAIEAEIASVYGITESVSGMLANHGVLVVVTRAHFVSGCTELDGGHYLCVRAHGALAWRDTSTIYVHPGRAGCLHQLLGHEILHMVVYHMLDGQPGHGTPGVYADTGEPSIDQRVRDRTITVLEQACVESARK